MTKIFPLIQVNFKLYAIDKEANINEADFFYDKDLSEIKKMITGHKNMKEFVMEAGSENCFKVIASQDETLGIALLPNIEESQRDLLKLAFKDFESTGTKFIKGTDKIIAANDWVRGYKAAKAKYEKIPTAVEGEIIDNQFVVKSWIY